MYFFFFFLNKHFFLVRGQSEMGPSCSPTLTTCQPKCNLTCELRAFESAPVFLFGGLVYTFGLPSLVGLYFCGKFADFAVGTGMMHWLRSHLIVQAHTRLPLWRTGSHMGLNSFRRCSKGLRGKEMSASSGGSTSIAAFVWIIRSRAPILGHQERISQRWEV